MDRDKEVEKLRVALASQIEMDILSGCAGCGCRIVDGLNHVTHDSYLVQDSNNALNLKIVCKECADNPEVVAKVLGLNT